MSGAGSVRTLGRLRLRTPRLVLRSWRRGDVAAFKEALDSSLDHLRRWLPFAHAEPSSPAVIEARLAKFERDFRAGTDWVYACLAPDERMALGGAGLHPRQGPGILEIGYWIRSSAVGQGYATEAAAALTRCAIERHGIATVEIRCDPENLVSARIPQRLGYRLRERLVGNAKTRDGQPRDTLVWELRADELTPQFAAAHPVAYEDEEVRMAEHRTENATLAGGCFWCLEAVFEQLEGVERVESGYSGGKRRNPTYEQVCSGTSGHAEVVQITFNPARISYRELLEIFFAFHDPTTLNRQGPDTGSQYRSAIFHHSLEQRASAEEVITALTEARTFEDPIVTEVTPFTAFYKAEGYHQGYFRQNPSQPYCRAMVAPKVAKLREQYLSRLKVATPTGSELRSRHK